MPDEALARAKGCEQAGANGFFAPGLAYEALIAYIRRVNIEDQVTMHLLGEYHADTSELVQLLRKGHYGVKLGDSDWDRLITWIDLNGPCHGTWNEVGPVPEAADRRRRELQQRFGKELSAGQTDE